MGKRLLKLCKPANEIGANYQIPAACPAVHCGRGPPRAAANWAKPSLCGDLPGGGALFYRNTARGAARRGLRQRGSAGRYCRCARFAFAVPATHCPPCGGYCRGQGGVFYKVNQKGVSAVKGRTAAHGLHFGPRQRLSRCLLRPVGSGLFCENRGNLRGFLVTVYGFRV